MNWVVRSLIDRKLTTKPTKEELRLPHQRGQEPTKYTSRKSVERSNTRRGEPERRGEHDDGAADGGLGQQQSPKEE